MSKLSKDMNSQLERSVSSQEQSAAKIEQIMQR
jgi:hypothetical protein